jgi:hypothetical protein
MNGSGSGASKALVHLVPPRRALSTNPMNSEACLTCLTEPAYPEKSFAAPSPPCVSYFWVKGETRETGETM